jgi:hypothetical protein
MDPMDGITDKEAQRAQPRLDLRREYERVRSPSPQSQNSPAYSADRAKLLCGSYRRDQVSDPEIFTQALTMVLEKYPRAVVEWATDPRTGIQSTDKFSAFPPNSGELKAFCDEEIARIRRMSEPRLVRKPHIYEPPPNYPGCWAKLFVGPKAPTYAAAIEWSKREGRDPRDWRMGELRGVQGIWVSLKFDDETRIARSKSWQRPSMESITESLARVLKTPRQYQEGTED